MLQRTPAVCVRLEPPQSFLQFGDTRTVMQVPTLRRTDNSSCHEFRLEYERRMAEEILSAELRRSVSLWHSRKKLGT